MESFCDRISRKKHVLDAPPGEIPLHRCLTTFDLTLMSIGAMVGSGIYIMTGVAARDLAGPSIVLSFLVAAVAIYLVAACFLEFAGRVQRTGSTYLFMYISMGELPAFIMGMSLLLGTVVSGGVNGRAWSAYLDFLVDGALANFTETHVAQWDVGPPIAKYPDFLAMSIIAVITIVVSAGAQCSSRFNSIFAMLNIAILVFVMAVGFVYADHNNWTSKETGGFIPYGWSGLFAGSGAAFWAFTGFEILVVCTEEAKDPQKTIPRGTAISILIVTVLYIGVAAAITLVCPYNQIDAEAPLPSAFAARGIHWAKYVTSVGPLFGLTTTLLNSLFGSARLAYAMADDGLLPSVFAWVSPRSKVPVAASLTIGTLMCVTSVFFELRDLLGFGIVIGLMQYIFIAVAVIILRYRPLATTYQPVEQEDQDEVSKSDLSEHEHSETNALLKEEAFQGNNSSVYHPLSNNLNRRRRNSSLSSSSLSDEGFHPSMDIRNTTANHKPGEVSHDFQGHTFLMEDLEGDGFTTTEDEMVLFDVRKLPATKHLQHNNNVRNHITGNNINSTKNTLEEHSSGEEGSTNRDSAALLGTSATSSSSRSVRVGCLQARFTPFLGRCFYPCAGRWVSIACVLTVLTMSLLSALLFYGKHQIEQGAWWIILLLCVVALLTILLVATIWIHQQSLEQLTFKASCVPVLPSVAILVCSLLMFANATLFSLLGCLCILLPSIILYLVYGIRHSKLHTSGAAGHSPGSDTVGLLDQESEDEV